MGYKLESGNVSDEFIDEVLDCLPTKLIVSSEIVLAHPKIPPLGHWLHFFGKDLKEYLQKCRDEKVRPGTNVVFEWDAKRRGLVANGHEPYFDLSQFRPSDQPQILLDIAEARTDHLVTFRQGPELGGAWFKKFRDELMPPYLKDGAHQVFAAEVALDSRVINHRQYQSHARMFADGFVYVRPNHDGRIIVCTSSTEDNGYSNKVAATAAVAGVELRASQFD